MKKMLLALFSVLFIGLYTSTTMAEILVAEHNGIPTAGQTRTEVVWFCDNIDDARTFVTARAKVDSYEEWIIMLRGIVARGDCKMGEVEYEIEEVVETVSGLYVENRTFGEPIPHYIVKSDNHFVVTY